MTVKTSYQPGEPIWVDLGTPDLEATVAFYGGLFGWGCERGPAEFGGYSNFTLEGRKVAGVMPIVSPEQHPVWTSYVCTDDADRTTALVGEAGGKVIAPPMDVADLGRMAVYLDPAGAAFGVWQPGTHLGTELVEVEGTPAWIELSTRDQDGVLPFYGTVFGWTTHVSPGYTELQLDGRSVAGCMDTPEEVPAEVPSFWMPYFLTPDPAAKAQQAQALGANLLVPFVEMSGVAFSVVADPHGSTFGLLRPPA
ncbi:MAG: VOC family protein [Mycobacteriales bacterium]